MQCSAIDTEPDHDRDDLDSIKSGELPVELTDENQEDAGGTCGVRAICRAGGRRRRGSILGRSCEAIWEYRVENQ